MTVPLVACAAIWGIGTSSPANVAWLSILHGVIGAAASAWTALRFVLRRRMRDVARTVPARLPGAGLLALYALLLLQPVLAMAGTMLHGARATLFGLPLPAVLPVDQPLALRIDDLHGGNALLLLGLIVVHLMGALRAVRHGAAAAPASASHRHEQPGTAPSQQPSPPSPSHGRSRPAGLPG